MGNDLANAALARFGDFELHIQNEELREGGMLVKLEPQAFKLLVFLVCRPWQLVRHEEICRDLWPKEHGDLRKRLSVAVLELRKKLGDAPDKPRYVKTVRKKGYTFICSVAWHDSAGSVIAESPGAVKGQTLPRSHTAWHKDTSRSLVVIGAILAVVVTAFVFTWLTFTPVIVSVTPILPTKSQTIVLSGRHFGTHTPYVDEGSEYIAIRDKTAGWAAGRKIAKNWDEIRLSVDSWTDSQIIVRGFSGAYGKDGWKLSPGDVIQIAVWNPQRTIAKAEAEAGHYTLVVGPPSFSFW